MNDIKFAIAVGAPPKCYIILIFSTQTGGVKMKGNKFLAAVLAASMAFSMVPATTIGVMAAIPAATSSNTADADGTVTSGNPTEADFGTVLGTISGDATATPVSVSTTAETLKKYLVTVAQTGSTSLKDATFDITELNAEAPSYDATTGTFTKGYLTGTIEAEGKDSTTSNSYDFRLTANTLDAADIANLAAQAAKAEIEKTDNATYTATGTVSKIAVLKKAEAAAAKVNAGVTVDVTMGDQPESTKDAQGSVTGTITTMVRKQPIHQMPLSQQPVLRAPSLLIRLAALFLLMLQGTPSPMM